MERYAWKAAIKSGKRAEYIRRHDELWPEMKSVLKEAGIVNYSIWLDGEEVFGYYECEKGSAYAARIPRRRALERVYEGRDGHDDGRKDGRAAAARRGVLSRINVGGGNRFSA